MKLLRFDHEFRQEFRQNWLLLLIAFLAFVVSMQLTSYVLPFVYPRVIAEFGWTREEATLIASIKYLFGIISCIIAGRLSDRFGPWLLLITCTLLSGLSLLAFIPLDGLMLYYAIGMVQGMVVPGGYVAMMVILSRAFARSQGTATGAALMGSTICSIIAPVAVVYAMEAWGWRVGVAAMSVGIWTVILPLFIFAAMSKSPSLAHVRSVEDKSGSEPTLSGGALMGQLTRSRDFWLIATAVLLAAVADQGFRQHQVLIFEDLGVSAATTALIISSIGVVGVFTRVLAGNILDAKSNRGLAVLFVAEGAASLLAFFLAFPAVIVLFVLFRAVSHSAITLDVSVMAKHIFGLRNVGAIIGILAAVGSLGSAIGPWLMGVIFDVSGTYKVAFVVFIALPILGAALTWMVKPHYWLEQLEARRARM